MKNKRVIVFVLCIAAQPALAVTKSGYISVHHEQRDGNHASGISVTTYNRGMALGISANKITANHPLELQDRTTIYPVYAFASMELRAPVTPYVELGIDLGDYLQSESLNESNQNQGDDQPKLDGVDIYGAIGLKTSMRHTPLDFTVYIKSYSIYFNDRYGNSSAGNTDATITMSGANIIFNY